jgi:alkylation response protein AidB-like acyl-CoA dehydrogenase
MSPYVAPLADMRFVLRELVDIDSLARLPDSESLADAELTDAILEQAARFASEVLAPLDRVGDLEGARWTEQGVVTAPGFQAAYREFVEAGWNNIEMPAQYGGQDLPAVLCGAIHEMFAAANKAFCMCPDLSSPAVMALAAAASEPLKALYIPNLVSGKWSATMNLTEPQAGSDVGALRTRAELRPDGSFRVFGQKIFISFGDHDLTDNIVHLVLARTASAPEGSRGISLFLVPKFLPDGRRNDVQCTGIEHKLGNHASPTCTLVYGALGKGAVGWLVGQENKGLQAMFVMMNGARFNVGLEGVAVGERAYQQAVAYARERVQGRLAGGGNEAVPIIRHPDVRRMLLTMRSQVEAMRAVAYVLAAARDIAARHPDPAVRRGQQAFIDLMIPVFKGQATETGIEVTSTSIQVHGGAGYIEDHGATQPLRDVRITTIYEGTTSIQAHDLVERKLVRDGGAAFRSWLSQVNATLNQLDARPPGDLTIIARKLRSSVAALQEATESVLMRYREQPLEMLAGSVPLLRAFGIVAGGWQMARAALVACRHLKEGRGDAVFLRGKLTSATFYAGHFLPQVAALADTAMHGGESVMAMDEAAF